MVAGAAASGGIAGRDAAVQPRSVTGSRRERRMGAHICHSARLGANVRRDIESRCGRTGGAQGSPRRSADVGGPENSAHFTPRGRWHVPCETADHARPHEEVASSAARHGGHVAGRVRVRCRDDHHRPAPVGGRDPGHDDPARRRLSRGRDAQHRGQGPAPCHGQLGRVRRFSKVRSATPSRPRPSPGPTPTRTPDPAACSSSSTSPRRRPSTMPAASRSRSRRGPRSARGAITITSPRRKRAVATQGSPTPPTARP